MLSAARTIVREKSDEPYCSCPSSPCAESEISVSETCMAFFEVQSVAIMMTPAVSRITKLAGTFSFRASMSMFESPEWRAIEKASKLATGTPMKFTRSLPAKARARAKVPERIVMRRMLIFSRWMKKSASEQTIQQASRDSSRWRSTNSMKACPSRTVLSPLKRAK